MILLIATYVAVSDPYSGSSRARPQFHVVPLGGVIVATEGWKCTGEDTVEEVIIPLRVFATVPEAEAAQNLLTNHFQYDGEIAAGIHAILCDCSPDPESNGAMIEGVRQDHLERFLAHAREVLGD